MDYGVVKVRFLTPVSVSAVGHYPVLDSVLMQRLCLLSDGNVDKARAQMPLARRESGFWMCGGGFRPTQDVNVCHQPYKVYRKLVEREVISLSGLSPAGLDSAVTRFFGQRQIATESVYRRSVNALTLHWRFLGDIDRIAALLDPDLEPYIGPGHSVGLGQIEQVAVDLANPADDDLKWLVTDPRGRLTRPIPVALARELALSGQEDIGTVEAPYWHKSTPRQPVVRPYPVA